MREKSSQSIKEIASCLLDENKLKTFLEFYDFLNSNKFRKGNTGFNPKANRYKWAIKYKNKRIGSFLFHGNTWSISYFDLFNRSNWFEKCEKYLTAELKDFILTNLNTTSTCCVKRTCHSVENKIILGEMVNSRVCACGPIMLNNPDGKIFEYAKELVLIGKSIVTEMAVSSIK